MQHSHAVKAGDSVKGIWGSKFRTTATTNNQKTFQIFLIFVEMLYGKGRSCMQSIFLQVGFTGEGDNF